jgi:hypothetical protein
MFRRKNKSDLNSSYLFLSLSMILVGPDGAISSLIILFPLEKISNRPNDLIQRANS